MFAVKSFEYKVVSGDKFRDLTKHGSLGWELVSVVQYGSVFYFYFKRQTEKDYNVESAN